VYLFKVFSELIFSVFMAANFMLVNLIKSLFNKDIIIISRYFRTSV